MKSLPSIIKTGWPSLLLVCLCSHAAFANENSKNNNTATQAPAEKQAPTTLQPNTANTRLAVDRLLRDARDQRQRGDINQASQSMLKAAKLLETNGFERDQVSVLRDMTLDTDPVFMRTGSESMAKYYYNKYSKREPHDAQWLLEAVAWAYYANNETLAKTFTARKPDKAPENLQALGKERGETLKADDAIYVASELIRTNQIDALRDSLKAWPYPIDKIHSTQGTNLLHSAVWYKKPDIAKMLVDEFGASVNTLDKQGDTALDYAEYLHAETLEQYLRSKGGTSSKEYGKQTRPKNNEQPTLEELLTKNPDALKLPANALAKPVTPPPTKTSP